MQLVAKIVKSYGVKGEIIISFTNKDFSELNIEEPIYIYFDGLSVPFYIDNYIAKGKRAQIHLVSVDDLNYAEELCDRDIFVDYAADSEDYDNLDRLISWSIIDKNQKVIGTIKDFEDIPGNLCIHLDNGLLIPFHEDFIIDIKEDQKEIIMDLPLGLI